MSQPYIVVVGASAGGVSALRELAANLPAGLPATLFVVLHVPSHFPSHLPEMLADAGPLRAAHARGGERIEAGRIYVAPPDFHLLVRRGRVELSRGPREHHARPAIDPLFRSAARAYGKRVAGVVMSGTLGDGTVGLMAIKSYGGTTVVQAPDEALQPSMPHQALQYAPVDYVLPVREIAGVLSRLAQNQEDIHEETRMDRDESMTPQMRRDFDAQAHGARAGQPSLFSCPDCGGVLWEEDEGGVLCFRCHQGHRYAPELLLIEQSENVENALWSAARALMERATLNRRLANRMREAGQDKRADALDEQAQRDQRDLKLLRERVLQGLGRPATDPGQAEDAQRTAQST